MSAVFARVVPALPVERAFDYRIPRRLEAVARVGCRVLIPVGKRRVAGVITALVETPEVPDAKDLDDVLDADQPALTPELLRLTRWVADYYVCAWGEALRAALPPGAESAPGLRIRRTDALAPQGRGGAAERAVLAFLSRRPETTLHALRARVPAATRAVLERLVQDGLIETEEQTPRRAVRPRLEKRLRLTEAGAAADPAGIRGARRQALLAVLREAAARGGGGAVPLAEALAAAGASRDAAAALVRQGLAEVETREVLRLPDGMNRAPAPPATHTLHDGQRRAFKAIAAAVAAERFEAFLLHGVTGSGKTEVYIAALKEVLARGKTGIILVPEIALTPQTVARFRAHLGDRIAVVHSRMSPGERYDAWRGLRSGRCQVVIGPRSAVLAPLDRLGLIVVDEEHEASYKQHDPAPRYHARDVAVMRARMNGAVCVLGSATPTLESWANAASGKFTLLSMPERVPVRGAEPAGLPAVALVDLTLERKKHRLHGVLSDTLREAIGARLERREQVILLQNRRGYAPVVECEACGWAPVCPNCSVAMIYHKPARSLRCHYCGRASALPPACPRCAAADLRLSGAGTQRVEEELAQVFPEARCIRMDLDTTGARGAHHRLLDRFGKHDADILIGTQMVAKGLDFGRVTLVGVVNADAGMLLPDFRAEERTFQLLTQVAGRAGRAGLSGEVLLQTRAPHHRVFRHTVRHDYAGFVAALAPEREAFQYPPFGCFAGVVFKGPDEERARRIAEDWTALLRALDSGAQVLGPEPAFVGKVKRQHRLHTIVKGGLGLRPSGLQSLIRYALAEYGAPPAGYRIAVDIDAVGLI